MALTFSLNSHTKLILIATIFIYRAFAIPTQSDDRPFNKIYAFGDSFTDTGNTKSVTGPSGFGHVSNLPYGITYFHRSTNRYSDGRLVIDFVAQALSLPFLPPYLHINNTGNDSNIGANFAVAGSTAINHVFFVKNNLSLDVTPQSLDTQLLWFNEYLERQGCNETGTEAECAEVFKDALFWVGEIGDNDYAYTLGSDVSSETIRKLATYSVSRFIQVLLNKGAKSIAVQGLPASGCLTLAMTLAATDDRDEIGCVKSVDSQSYAHNAVLQANLQDLRKQFPNAVITYLDYWNAYKTVIKNPKGYGFKEPFTVCCGNGDPPYNFSVFEVCGTPKAKACANPSQYINWDGVHLTEGMYKVIAKMFLNGPYSHPPFNNLLDKKNKL